MEVNPLFAITFYRNTPCPWADPRTSISSNLKNQFAIAYKPKLRYQGQKVSQDQEPTPT